ncbi:MAG: D-alanine--D-alanine ligase [Bdellovibrionaceae bacterium]|nr:D-alanine--D-alanine ligase [Bdellovibrionales bacterium]MCB9083523.1 D-alanine--D-alanine ligase [Pseudobdellovibrionaceae bacterium]
MTKQKKIRVGVLFGGKSAEHEISLLSARNIIEAMDREKFDVVLIGVDKKGCWHLNESSQLLLESQNPKLIKLNAAGMPISVAPGTSDRALVASTGTLEGVDVVFPILHGPMGEDGTVQGLLKLAGIPFVGSDVLGSAVGMDKDVMKRLLRDSGLPVLPWVTLNRRQGHKWDAKKILGELGPTVFVKPANMGSSVGVNRATSESELDAAIAEAFQFDHKVLVEKGEKVREIEVAVLDGDPPQASVAGEIVPKGDFYSYEAKYVDENGADLVIPARLEDDQSSQVRDLALKTFATLDCFGLGRVDFFLTADGKFWVNEINTMPGFTRISMYPSLWKASGISYPDLIEKLIHLAIERGKRDQSLKSDY